MSNQTHCQQWLLELMAQGLTLQQIARDSRLSVFTLKLVIKDNKHNLYPSNFSKLFHYYLSVTVQSKVKESN